MRWAGAIGVGVAATAWGLCAWGEWATWRASFDGVPSARRRLGRQGGDDVVLVLGFASAPDGGVSRIQRWRLTIGVRSVDPDLARFIVSGGPTHGSDRSEASVMGACLVDTLGVPARSVTLEERSTNTWENIALSLPLLRDAIGAGSTSIVIASNTFHARRARRYLARQDPAVAALVRRGRDYVPGEKIGLTALLALYEWRRARRDRAATAASATASNAKAGLSSSA